MSTTGAAPVVMPYSAIVSQDDVKCALEVAFVVPAMAGVLLSGQRGTAKSTAVRAFAQMVYGGLPVTLPINATDDRVVGGWRLDDLMRGEAQYRPGLLEEAGKKGMLYVDEVNLLDDHIVNLILDVLSTGVLSVQREMVDREVTRLAFSLVGTMNPEEGGLRPQLLDRFGLMVGVQPANDKKSRRQILDAVLAFDEARNAPRSTRWLRNAQAADREHSERLHAAQEAFADVEIPKRVRQRCAQLGEALALAGHRGEYVTALAARGLAAIEGAPEVTAEHVVAVAPMALAHRTVAAFEGGDSGWTPDNQQKLESIFGHG